MVDIERLRALMVAADPLPTSASWDVNALRVLLRHGSASVSGRRAYPNERLDRDAALIAAAINALPDLLGELAMLRELRDATLAAQREMQRGVLMDGGQWGDAMNAIREVRDRLDGRMDRIEAEQRKNTPTLRDRFAMAALTGALPAFFEEGSSWEDYDDMAGTCYQVADAMLRARGGEDGKSDAVR